MTTLLLTFTVPPSLWLWPAGALLLAAVVLLVWSYGRASWSGLARKLASGFKLLGIGLLLLCLVEPLWSGRRAKSGANLFAVVVDNSAGMTIRDRGATQTRGQELAGLIDSGKTGWLAALSDSFQVRPYLFDSRLRRTTDFSELTFDGRSSAVGTVLRTLAERYRSRPLAGVLLLTDGCATDLGEQSYDLSECPPVYPVAIGQTRPQIDLALGNVAVTQTAFEDAPVVIQADVQATGFAGRTVVTDLLDSSGTLVERQQWKPGTNTEKQVFRYRLRPERSGVLFYQVRTAEAPEPESDPLPEATQANNARTTLVDRGSGPYRVLYVAGRPNWEYKFLRRALAEDPQVELVALIRVAEREPKYDWRGRTGETSNPLYRGFDRQAAEQTEQYDQPVFVGLNTRDESELRDGFPQTREELFEYHAVILDDVGAEFFTHDQMELIRTFVTDRGGGFLMLGGKESFRQGDFDRTPIAAILPVYLDPLRGDSTTRAVRFDLTRQGWLQPWVRLRDNEKDENERLAAMPEFRVLNRTDSTKPGAQVMGTVDFGAEQRFPALVVQRFGNGRTAALTIGDVWRWGLSRPELRDDMERCWRQTLRWLVADVPERTFVRVTRRPTPTNELVAIAVRARDNAFEPIDNASVTIEVHEPDGEKTQLTAVPTANESGLFEAPYVPRRSGGFVARAVVTDPNGAVLGDAETGWPVDLEGREFHSVTANRALLDQIARQTGGRVLAAADLGDFARRLPHRDVPITEVWVKPFWDLPGVLPAVFAFAMLCFIAEWALRRWKGMA